MYHAKEDGSCHFNMGGNDVIMISMCFSRVEQKYSGVGERKNPDSADFVIIDCSF